MKKRNLGIMVVLMFVTLGIYVPIWVYLSRKEITNTIRNPKAVPPFFYLVAPVLLIVVAVIIAFLAGYGQPDGSNAFANILVLLAGIVGIIAGIVIPFWWFYKYFKTVHEITHYTDGTLLYIIWILCTLLIPFPIWMLLAQNDMNKTLTYGPGQLPGQPQAPTAQPPVPQDPTAPPTYPGTPVNTGL